MFRPMRRARQQLPESEAIRILEQGSNGVLAVLGDDGYPYAVPLNYVYADGRIWVHCARAGHKLDAIRRCDRVSFCVVAEDAVVPERLLTRYRSVVAFGRARVLADAEDIRRAARRLGLKYSSDAAYIDREIERDWAALACVEIKIEHLTGKEALELTNERP